MSEIKAEEQQTNSLTDEGHKSLILLELIVRLSALENLLIRKNIVSKDEIINEVQVLSEKAAELARDNDILK